MNESVQRPVQTPPEWRRTTLWLPVLWQNLFSPHVPPILCSALQGCLTNWDTYLFREYHLDLTVPSQKGAIDSQLHHTLLVFASKPPSCLEDVMMDSFTSYELRNEVKESRQMRNSFRSRRGSQARANRSERFTRR
jgi:hypothetical protein